MGFTAGTGKELRVRNIRLVGTSAPNPAPVIPPPTNPPPSSGRFRVAPYYEVVVQGNPSINGMKHVTFAFIIADGNRNASFEGTPLSNYKPLIDSFKASGGTPILSFGGAACCELAYSQTNESALRAAYEQFYTVYGIKIWDFDIEGSIVSDIASVDRRNRVLSSLQSQYPDLEIYFTVAISNGGLTSEVLNMLNRAKSAGVKMSLVNAMIFDYYTSGSNNNIDDSKSALTALRRQLDAMDRNLKIGATLMIGRDDSGKIMTVADTTTLLNWISVNIPSVSHIAYWAMHRDKPGPADQLWASAGITGFTAGDYLKVFKSFA
jgi:chitinase